MIGTVMTPKPHDQLDVAALGDEALADRYPPPADPWLRTNFVTSIDGAVAVHGRSRHLSSPADRRVFAMLRMRCDALLVGAGTLRDEGYGPLRMDERQRDWRTRHGLATHPVMVILSRTLDLDPSLAAFTGAPERAIVIAPASAPADRRAALAGTTEVLTAGEDSVDLPAAVAELHRRGLRQILSEGGPQVLGGLTAADLVDEMCLTVAPVLAGAGAGRITAGPASPLRPMSLEQVLAADGTLFLRYLRVRE